MLLKLFNFLSGKLLVLGDIMLDEYWIGETNRISPEAPVPIVLIKNTDYRLGGAANVALNIAAFGCHVDLLGLVGEDQAATTINTLLKQSTNINNLITTTTNQPTINKLRIISNDQQVFRIDREQNYCIKSFTDLVTAFEDAITKNTYDAIVLSDYNKGCLQNPQLFINLAKKYNIPVIIDPKNPDYWLYKDASILTPNLKEFIHMVEGYKDKIQSTTIEQYITEKGHNLINQLNLQALIITRGKDGISLLTNDWRDQHFAASQHEVFDVTGAGDTVTACIAACIASNNNLQTATQLATIAAGINVSKLGTSCIDLQELQEALISNTDTNDNIPLLKLGIIDQEQLSIIIKQRQLIGETIVLINGCFDILHSGHIQYIRKAKSFGTRLVIAVNSDQSVKNLKGNNRPINILEHRMQVLAALKDVDWVVDFDDIRPGNLIKQLNPDILVKTKEVFQNIEEIPEYEGTKYILEQGGKVYLLDRPLTSDCDISSTKIIESIKT
jgi:D-beta-D-heptose 7-phosphate kinase/D-beta-D-heptose 1-phosphate adenosyltransferase